MRLMLSIYLIKLEFLLNSKIRIEQINLFELKLNLSIRLNKILERKSNKYISYLSFY